MVVVLLHNPPRALKAIFGAAEEIEVRLQIVVLYLKCRLFLLWILDLSEQIDCFLNSILQL